MAMLKGGAAPTVALATNLTPDVLTIARNWLRERLTLKAAAATRKMLDKAERDERTLRQKLAAMLPRDLRMVEFDGSRFGVEVETQPEPATPAPVVDWGAMFRLARARLSPMQRKLVDEMIPAHTSQPETPTPGNPKVTIIDLGPVPTDETPPARPLHVVASSMH